MPLWGLFVDLKHRNRFRVSFNHLGSAGFHIESAPKPLCSLVADQDVTSKFLREILYSRCQIDGIADQRVRKPVIAAGNAGQHLTCVNANTADIGIDDSYAHSILLRDCYLEGSASELTVPTQANSYILSQLHDHVPGITRIWGEYTLGSGILQWNYADPLYSGAGDGNTQKENENLQG